MADRRVVITGLGVVSSIGIGKDRFWDNLISGKSGISEVETFDTSKYENHRGGEVKDFNPLDFMDGDKAKKMGRASRFGIAAAKLALADSKINISSMDGDRIGVIMGTTMADSQRLEEMDKVWVESGEESVNPSLIPQYPGNALATSIAFELKVSGIVSSIPTACSAGNYSIGYSYDLIKTGKSDYMLAGGADSFSRVAFTGFNRLFAVAPEKCQPFDKNRKGMMVGEGAGVLLLES
ncbi:MAG: beta-ketoacyl synthase N-terminal-like domain-containing protein, partial [Caldisericia bacterium]|nr:beta-ketoacyl synthase N-terminal-like domain-containing protein [Caldisericia bacterium]